MKNQTRFLVKFLREYCEKNGFEIISMSYDWIFQIQANLKLHHIFGYDLGLNNSTTAQICKDKAATYDILNANGINALEHRVFLHPRFLQHLPISDNSHGIAKAFDEFNHDIVMKPNEGTGGLDVYRAKNIQAVEEYTNKILCQERSMAISPFINFDEEVRIYMLFGVPRLCVSKHPPQIIGDGKSPLLTLVKAQVDNRTFELLKAANPSIENEWQIAPIPMNGEKIKINWRNNLGQGAQPKIINACENEIKLAIDAARALNLKFGSVDILKSGADLKVLEVNGGVMMENLIQIHPNAQNIAQTIYEDALDAILK